jgi:hypothetical protein
MRGGKMKNLENQNPEILISKVKEWNNLPEYQRLIIQAEYMEKLSTKLLTYATKCRERSKTFWVDESGVITKEAWDSLSP